MCWSHRNSGNLQIGGNFFQCFGVKGVSSGCGIWNLPGKFPAGVNGIDYVIDGGFCPVFQIVIDITALSCIDNRLIAQNQSVINMVCCNGSLPHFVFSNRAGSQIRYKVKDDIDNYNYKITIPIFKFRPWCIRTTFCLRAKKSTSLIDTSILPFQTANTIIRRNVYNFNFCLILWIKNGGKKNEMAW